MTTTEIIALAVCAVILATLCVSGYLLLSAFQKAVCSECPKKDECDGLEKGGKPNLCERERYTHDDTQIF